MAKHNIETLTQDLQKLNSNFKSFKKDVKKEFNTMQPQVQAMHDFIVDQKGFERGVSKKEQGASLNINSEIIKLLALALTIIAALVGASKIQ